MVKLHDTNAAEGVAQNNILHYSSLKTDRRSDVKCQGNHLYGTLQRLLSCNAPFFAFPFRWRVGHDAGFLLLSTCSWTWHDAHSCQDM